MKNIFNVAAAFWIVGVGSAYAIVAPINLSPVSDPGVGYHVSINAGGTSSSSSDPASATLGSKTTQVVTAAGNGAAFAQASMNNFKGFTSANSSNGTFTSNSLANFEANDLVFTDGVNSSVTTSIHLHLDGSLLDTSGFSGNQGIATVGVIIAVKRETSPPSNTIDFEQGTAQLSLNDNTSAAASSSGLLSGAITVGGNVNFDIVTNSFTVPTNTPLLLEMELDTAAAAEIGNGVLAGPIVQADFSNTLEFNPSGPVFTSPVGDSNFSANSTESGIVNNAAVTPEPFSLSIVALPALFFFRRRASR